MSKEFETLYEKLPNGIIKQRDAVVEMNYDEEYTQIRYDALPKEIQLSMSHLRLGNLLGAMKGRVPESLLEIGYGNGAFLNAASNIIPNVAGYDIPPAYPLDNSKIKQVDDTYKDNYQVVCFFDSLEHFENIYEISNLKTEYIYISLPWCPFNRTGNVAQFMNWKHRRYGEHLWHFDDKSLTNFMKEIGFKKLQTSNIEDTIRKNPAMSPNILTGFFGKMK